MPKFGHNVSTTQWMTRVTHVRARAPLGETERAHCVRGQARQVLGLLRCGAVRAEQCADERVLN
jgi:hypothetical protein